VSTHADGIVAKIDKLVDQQTEAEETRLRQQAKGQLLRLRRGRQRDGEPTYSVLTNRGKRLHVALTLAEVADVLNDPEKLIETRRSLPVEKAPQEPVTDHTVEPTIDVDAVTDLGADEARELTDQIRTGLGTLRELITRAYLGRAWIALGYESWDAYCIREFETSWLRVPREERPEMVTSLRHAGLSIRAIASATGAGVGTIHREIEAGAAARALGVPSGTPAESVDEEQIGDADQIAEELIAADRIAAEPAPIIGTDRKTYRPQRKPAPKPEPIPMQGRPREGYRSRSRDGDTAMMFVLQARSAALALDTLVGFAKTLDADAKRKVLDKHREDIESCVAKLAAVVEQFAAVDGSDVAGRGGSVVQLHKADERGDGA
jgi:hypothetical protein